MRTLFVLALVACSSAPAGSAAGTPAAAAAPAAAPAEAGLPDPMATVAGEPISASDVDAKAASGLQAARQQMYEARRGALDELIVDRMLAKEATARGTTSEKLLADEVDAKAPAPSDAEVEAFFKQNEAKMGGQPIEAMKPRITAFLQGQAKGARMGAFVDELKKKYAVDDKLEPPRIAIGPGSAPRLGSPTAPVQIIEFSDFQCPYCSRAHDTVEEVIKKYGDKVSVVYRHFPLSFHDRARPAAEASECANAAGKFWEYHNQLFANQRALGDEDLKKYAKEVGLDAAAFDTCMSTHAGAARVDEDMKDGAAVGMTGTPGFYINGVNLPGAVPIEQFSEVIDRELARHGG